MRKRLYAIVKGHPKQRRVRHYVGLPPRLTEGEDRRHELPLAKAIVLEETSNGVYLYRYAGNGEFAGETWHLTIADAEHQAAYEFAESLEEWHDVPESEDARPFVLRELGLTDYDA
ncbi:MAG: hypothetical protein WD939_00430 [Dehalococcoidia bacterium]